MRKSKSSLPETIAGKLLLQEPRGPVNLSNMTTVDTVSETAEEHQHHVSEPTFFERMCTSFTQVPIDRENNINTEHFLNACRDILNLIDLLGGCAILPVKIDVSRNIRNLETEHGTSPDATRTLQAMLLRENYGKARKSLLWLNRGLQFLACFLHELLNTEDETAECINRAYDNSLREHHPPAIQGLARLYGKAAAPSRQDFFALLFGSPKQTLYSPGLAQQYDKYLLDARIFCGALDNVVSIIIEFYRVHKIPE